MLGNIWDDIIIPDPAREGIDPVLAPSYTPSQTPSAPLGTECNVSGIDLDGECNSIECVSHKSKIAEASVKKQLNDVSRSVTNQYNVTLRDNFEYINSIADQDYQYSQHYASLPSTDPPPTEFRTECVDGRVEWAPGYAPLPPPPPPPSFTTRDESTPVGYTAAATWLNPSALMYLDRHNVDCGSDGINGFSFDRVNDQHHQYNYTCLEGIGGSTTSTNTSPTTWGGNRVHYGLANQTVDCGKKPITQFRMTRHTDGNPYGIPNLIRYDYKCNNTETTGDCRELDVVGNTHERRSPWADRGGDLRSLEDADPQCEGDEVLTKFKFYRANKNQGSEGMGERGGYKYTCCKMDTGILVPAPAPAPAPTQPRQPAAPAPAPPPPSFTIRDESTPVGYTGSHGTMYYLDRHNVDCGSDGINGFSFDRVDMHHHQYNYKCLSSEEMGTSTSLKGSGSNDWGGNSVIYLDRHNVDCGIKPITQFKLTRVGPTGEPSPVHIEYSYNCNDTETTGECRELDVVGNTHERRYAWHGGDLRSLEGADPQCEGDEVLTKFRLYRANPGQTSEASGYKYTCCKMKAPEPEPEPEPAPAPAPPPPSHSTNGRCGWAASEGSNGKCPPYQCCSAWGYCGTGATSHCRKDWTGYRAETSKNEGAGYPYDGCFRPEGCATGLCARAGPQGCFP